MRKKLPEFLNHALLDCIPHPVLCRACSHHAGAALSVSQGRDGGVQPKKCLGGPPGWHSQPTGSEGDPDWHLCLQAATEKWWNDFQGCLLTPCHHGLCLERMKSSSAIKFRKSHGLAALPCLAELWCRLEDWDGRLGECSQGQRRMSDPRELKVQVVASHPVWVPGTKLESCGRTERALSF